MLRRFAWLLVVACLVCVCAGGALAAGVMTLPSALTVIDDQAFLGAEEITQVNLPSGVTEIGSQAFAYSGLKTINLPASITYIADDAFEGCVGVSPWFGTTDCYAYRWWQNYIGPFRYNVLEDGTAEITGCKITEGELPPIPATINGYTVTAIGNYAFQYRSGLTGDLVIPDSVTSIGYQAFYYCSGLTGDLVIPDSVTSIGSFVFGYCTGFKGELILPETLTSIGDCAFYGCTGLTDNLILPDAITHIGDFAFSGCTGFTGELILPETLTNIGNYAFNGCTGFMGELILPETLTSISDGAFAGCTGFTGELILPETLTSIGYSAFEGCTGLTDNLILPDAITYIGERAFYGCTGIEGVLKLPTHLTYIGNDAFGGNGPTFYGQLKLPSTLTYIGDDAFCYQQYLTGRLTLPEGLTHIGERAFSNCSGLTGDLVIPEGITEINDSAFAYCTGFKGKLILPESVTSIGDTAFRGCNFTGELKLPSKLKKIGDFSFNSCTGLGGQLIIPDGVKTIGAYSFICTNFTGDLVIPDSVTKISEYSFSCMYELNGRITLSRNLRMIPANAFGWEFDRYGTQVKEVFLPDSILFIADDGFANFNYVIPIFESEDSYAAEWWAEHFSADSYPESAHPYECYQENAWHGSNVTSALAVHFAAETQVDPDDCISIRCYGKSYKQSFYGSELADRTIYIPSNQFYIDIYGVNGGGTGIHYGYRIDWIEELVAEPVAITGLTLLTDNPHMGGSVAWQAETTGNLLPFTYVWSVRDASGAEVASYEGNLDTYTWIPEAAGDYTVRVSVRDIGDNTAGVTSEVCTVRVPEGDELFTYRVLEDGTAEITGALRSEGELPPIPAEFAGYPVAAIADNAFNGCRGLTGTLTLPDSLLTIGEYAFFGCDGFTGDLVIPDSVQEIGQSAFGGMDGLDGRITLPRGFTQIHAQVVSAANIKEIYLPASIEYIDDNAFWGFDNVTPIFETDASYAYEWWRNHFGLDYTYHVLPDGTVEITGCRITKGELPPIPSKVGGRTVTSIGYSAFAKYQPDGVETNYTGTLVLPDTLTSIGNNAFAGCAGLTGNLVIPDSVQKIGEYAFSYCTGFTGDLVILDNVQTIGNDAFRGCTGLTGTLTLSEGLQTIGNGAFAGCAGLTGNLVIPDSMQKIGTYAFLGCEGLTGTLTLPEGLQRIGRSAFGGCSGFTGDLVVPDSVQTIESSAFNGMSGLNGRVSLPRGLTTLPDYMLTNDKNSIKEIFLPDSITSIDDNAFPNGSGQWQLVRPIFETEGSYAYNWWEEHIGIPWLLPESAHPYVRYDEEWYVGSENAGGFILHFAPETEIAPGDTLDIWDREWHNLTGRSYTGTELADQTVIIRGAKYFSIYIGGNNSTGAYGYRVDSIEEIPAQPIAIQQVEFTSFPFTTDRPAWGVTLEGNLTPYTFEYSIEHDGELLDSYYSINYEDQNYVEFYTSSFSVAGEYTLSVKVTDAFGNTAEYTTEPGTLREPVGDELFRYRVLEDGTAEITGYRATNCELRPIPAELDGYTVTRIGDKAFGSEYSYNSRHYTGELSIPNTVTSIGNYAFANCDELTGNLLMPDSLTVIGDYAFAVWSNGLDGVLKLPSRLTEIGESAFENSSLYGQLKLPATLTSLGNRAFYCCRNLSGHLTLPEGLTRIGDYTFYGCENLTGDLVIPEGVTEIGKWAFSYCSSLNGRLVIPDSVTTIGAEAFTKCSSLTGDLVLPSKLTAISDRAFEILSNMHGTLTIPDGVKTIGATAFMLGGFTGDLVIPDSVTKMGERAFYGCDDLDGRITLSKNLTLIPREAFASNGSPYYPPYEKLREIYLPDNISFIAEDAFEGFDYVYPIFESEGSYAAEWWAEHFTKPAYPESSHPDGVNDAGWESRYWQGYNKTTHLRVHFAPETCFADGDFLEVGSGSTSKNYEGAMLADQTITVPGNRLKLSLYRGGIGAAYGYRILSIEEFTAEPVGLTGVELIESRPYAGGSMRWEAHATGTMTPFTYSFDVYDATGDRVFSTVGEDCAFEWVPQDYNALGEYTMRMLVTDSNGNTAGWSSEPFTLRAPVGDELFSYRLLEDGTVTIVDYLASNCELRPIPAQLDGRTVSAIQYSAFANKNLTGSVVLPDTITSIGDRAFTGNRGLTGSLTIPNSVTSIGERAFMNCNGFNGTLTLSENLTTIGAYAFSVTSFRGALVVPNSVTSIGEYAFEHCQNLSSLTLSENLTEIASYTFAYCLSLCGPLTIPARVTKIDRYAFGCCDHLSGQLVIPNGVTEIGLGAFIECKGLSGDLILPEGLTTIGYIAFLNCTGFTGKLVLPKSLSTIDDRAFEGCNRFGTAWNSGKLVLPEGLTNIGAGAFKDFSGIDRFLKLPVGLKSVGAEAFLSDNVEKVYLPSSLEFIGDNAFGTVEGVFETRSGYAFDWWQAQGLPEGLPESRNPYTHYEGYDKTAWQGKDDTKSVEITFSSDTYFAQNDTFVICNEAGELVASYTYNELCGQTISLPGNYFTFHIACNSYTPGDRGYKIESIKEIPFVPIALDHFTPTSEYYLGQEMPFCPTFIGDCKPFTYTYTVYAGDEVVYSEENVTSEVLRYTAEAVGTYTVHVRAVDARGNVAEATSGPVYVKENGSFYYTVQEDGTAQITSLDRSITELPPIPETLGGYPVTSIGDDAFRNRSELTGELILPDTITSIGDRAFTGNSGLTGSLIIPNSVTTIGESAFHNCTGFTGELVLPDSVTTIGERAFQDCNGFTGPLTLSENLTTIGALAFYFTTFRGQLNLPEGLTSIGDYAFFGCNGFEGDIVIPNSVTSIGEFAFSCQGALGTITLSESLTVIPPYAFGACTAHGDLVIPASVTEIGRNAFGDCANLDGDLILPEGLTTIGNDAFSRCTKLGTASDSGKLVLPASLTTIGDRAFSHCTGLTGAVTIPAGVTSLGQEVFAFCEGITAVHIPASVTSIHESAFERLYPQTLTVYGKSGSIAEYWAKECGCRFVVE